MYKNMVFSYALRAYNSLDKKLPPQIQYNMVCWQLRVTGHLCSVSTLINYLSAVHYYIWYQCFVALLPFKAVFALKNK